jgi:S-formylglutathione hydrolase FrmB
MFELDQIPLLRGPRPDGAERVRRSAPAATAEGVRRRSMLGGAMAGGTALGLAALRVFSPAREAMSDGYVLAADHYDVYGKCPSYAASHNCSPGCGPSTVVSGACKTGGKWRGYHRSAATDPGVYKLRPNECYAGRYDGWVWHYAHACGKCKKSVTWRCTDGWKKSTTGGWYKSICRWSHACS